jgi:hypothetical protein
MTREPILPDTDSYDGSDGAPWATIQKAISHGLSAGDTVIVGADEFASGVFPPTPAPASRRGKKK